MNVSAIKSVVFLIVMLLAVNFLPVEKSYAASPTVQSQGTGTVNNRSTISATQ